MIKINILVGRLLCVGAESQAPLLFEIPHRPADYGSGLLAFDPLSGP